MGCICCTSRSPPIRHLPQLKWPWSVAQMAQHYLRDGFKNTLGDRLRLHNPSMLDITWRLDKHEHSRLHVWLTLQFKASSTKFSHCPFGSRFRGFRLPFTSSIQPSWFITTQPSSTDFMFKTRPWYFQFTIESFDHDKSTLLTQDLHVRCEHCIRSCGSLPGVDVFRSSNRRSGKVRL